MAKLKEARDPNVIERDWETNPRWNGITREYTAEDVLRLRGSIDIRYTLAEMGAERLWQLLNTEPFVNALGALTGNQAVQQVRAGLKAIYLSGWQVAADANLAGHMYPDQSLYPSNSVPQVVKRINQALQRADQIDHLEGRSGTHWFAPIIADAEAGFGGALNAHELMKMMIEAGAAAVHFEDQLASEKKCGHLGGKVLIPTQAAIRALGHDYNDAPQPNGYVLPLFDFTPGVNVPMNPKGTFKWTDWIEPVDISSLADLNLPVKGR